MKLKAVLIAASALIAATAVADDRGFYAGASVGWSKISLPESDITSTIDAAFVSAGAPLTAWSAKTDDSDIMWSVFAGYRIMKYVAVEAGYLDTGTASYTGNGLADVTVITDPGPPPVTQVVPDVPTKAKVGFQATGWPVSVLGIWPISSNWEVFGRVGGFFGSVKEDLHVTATDTTSGDTVGAKAHYSANSNEFLYGVGFDSRFMQNWAARFEWMAISSLGNNSTGTADWNSFQFSLLYRF